MLTVLLAAAVVQGKEEEEWMDGLMFRDELAQIVRVVDAVVA